MKRLIIFEWPKTVIRRISKRQKGILKFAAALVAFIWLVGLIAMAVRSSNSFGEKDWVLLITFFATILLIFTLIARAGKKAGEAKKRKAYTTPGAEKKGGETGSEKAAPEKTRSLGWLWTILVLAALCFVGWKFLLPRVAAAGKPDITLTSVSESGYIKLALKPKVTVMVMPSADTTATDTIALDDTAFYDKPDVEPGEEVYNEKEGGCWTDWLVRPYGARGFWYEPSGTIDIEIAYANGERNLLLGFDPTTEKVEEEKVTGVRFRNWSVNPVSVSITMF